jgi:multimeric flavodoxin WrbA
MVKVIGIVGSPRKDGNTNFLVSQALQAAFEEGAVTELIHLADKNIQPCDGCRKCRETKECHIKDDAIPLFDEFLKADGIIIGTPTYFGSATPQVKILIDRIGYLALAKGRPFENKIGGPLIVARRAGQNFTFAQLIYFFFIMGMIIPGVSYWTIAFGREKGEAQKDEEGVRVAREFGRKVAILAKKKI